MTLEQKIKSEWLKRADTLRNHLAFMESEKQIKKSKAEYAGISYDNSGSGGGSSNTTQKKYDDVAKCDEDIAELRKLLERIEKEKQLGIDKVREQFDSIINNLKPEDLDEIEDGVLPSAIEKLVVLDPKTSRLMSKEFDDVVIATIYDLFDLREYLINKKVEEIEQESAVTEQ